MACTWAVESVVVAHLNHQLEYLAHKNDAAAFQAIQAILDDEVNHRDVGLQQGGANIFYTPLRFLISTFTEGVIRFGLR
jgi:ubiquinone biosynthesis monooxygenase Coq7